MNKRIKQVRVTLGLTQEDFGKRLGVGRGVITNIEFEKTSPKDTFVDLICREFGVSEQWLRTGKGDMFPPRTRADEIADFANDLMHDAPDSFRSVVISFLCKWDVEDWEAVADIIKKHGGLHYPPKEKESNQ